MAREGLPEKKGKNTRDSMDLHVSLICVVFSF